jgi:Txe/YoeB family toxin of Txe-Axe toxin-antitoxin module
VRIEYSNEIVKKNFENFNLIKKDKGADLARTIKKRHDQLKAAEKFSIYLDTGLGKPHPLHGNLKGRYGISITGNIRLVVAPDSKKMDSVSLKECKVVIIEGVMDYHGQKVEWIIS